MMSVEEYRRIVSELLDELPEEFFRGLSGGVIVSEATVIPKYARENDLFTMGEYRVRHGIRQVVMFKGSFDRTHPQADAEQARDVLRRVLRHEFRHHLEWSGGIHGPSSLEAEDEREKERYLSRHGEPKRPAQ